MRKKHYSFWLHAKNVNEPNPVLGFDPSSHQKKEHMIVSLSSYAQQREEAERQEQAQQWRINQYRNQGPKLGGRDLG